MIKRLLLVAMILVLTGCTKKIAPPLEAAQQRDITELLGITAAGEASQSASIPVVLATEYTDDTVSAIQVIDIIHHEVHEGEMFSAQYTSLAVADAATVDLMITTGAVETHMAFGVTAGGEVLVDLEEDATVAAGTSLATHNMNRGSSITPVAAVSTGPTVSATSAAPLINDLLIPGGDSKQTRIGGGARSNVEWILAESTDYFLRVTNTSGGAIDITVELEFYEE